MQLYRYSSYGEAIRGTHYWRWLKISLGTPENPMIIPEPSFSPLLIRNHQ